MDVQREEYNNEQENQEEDSADLMAPIDLNQRTSNTRR